MIEAVFHKDEEDKITSFKVEGHAGYAPSGRDVVCAAVSALVVGTVNGLQELTEAEFNAEVSEGIIEVDIYTSTAYSNILLRSMIMSLEGIQEEYSDNIIVKYSK